jgi:putative ABC transport system permease protein
MFKNYLQVAFRSQWRKNGIYNFINTLGLAVAMTACLLIIVFVAHELSFDRFHANASRIYKTVALASYEGNATQMTKMSVKFGGALQQSSPLVERYVRIREGRKAIISSDAERQFFEDGFVFADPAILSVFSFRLIEGNAKLALSKPFSVLITEDAARKYFGKVNPVGKTLSYNNEHRFEITGIIGNVHTNSTITFDFIGSFSSLGNVERSETQGFDDDGIPYEASHVGLGAYTTFVLLNPVASAKQVEVLIPNLVRQSGVTDDNVTFQLKPLLALHLESNNGIFSSSRYIYIFLGIAIAILVSALINYMSITTALATKRAKEVGVRKVMGASPAQLVYQFYAESVMINTLGFVLAIIIALVLHPVFFSALEVSIDLDFLYNPLSVVILLAFLLLCCFLAGSYPSILLSRFKPVEVLQGKFTATRRGASIRKVFTIIQFSIAAGLILCSIIIWQQLRYLQGFALGLQKEQVIVLPLDASVARSYTSLKNRIRQETAVESVAAATTQLFRKNTDVLFTQTPQTKEDVEISSVQVDENFIGTLGIKWKIKPDDLAALYAGNKIIINETAVSKLKINERPVGQKLKIGKEVEIAGVLHNFHFTSLHRQVDALMLSFVKDTASTIATSGGCLYIRLNGKASVQDEIAAIEKIYQAQRLVKPFEYYFLDEAFDQLYKNEVRVTKMFTALTGMAIMIACLGLFGLVTFTVQIRTKEIGIRKVLGASVADTFVMVFKEFFGLIIVALLVAFPLAWYGMQQWLQNYPYQIGMEWWFFVVTMGLILLIGLCTISSEAIKAASANPIDSIRKD